MSIFWLCVCVVSVVESHPDSTLEDLRLDALFTELRNHIDSYDLDSMNKKVERKALHSDRSFYSERLIFILLSFLQDHSHTPWIIIIAKYLEKWYDKVTHHSNSNRNVSYAHVWSKKIKNRSVISSVAQTQLFTLQKINLESHESGVVEIVRLFSIFW